MLVVRSSQSTRTLTGTKAPLSSQEAVSKELDQIEKPMNQLLQQREYMDMSDNEELRVNQQLRSEIQQLKEELKEAKHALVIEKDKNLLQRCASFDRASTTDQSKHADAEAMLLLKQQVKSLQDQLLGEQERNSTATTVASEQELHLTQNVGRLKGEILKLQSKLKDSEATIAALRNEVSKLAVVEPNEEKGVTDMIDEGSNKEDTKEDDIASIASDESMSNHVDGSSSSPSFCHNDGISKSPKAATIETTATAAETKSSVSTFSGQRAAHWKAMYEDLLARTVQTANEHKNSLDDKDSQISFLQQELFKQKMHQQQLQAEDSSKVITESTVSTTERSSRSCDGVPGVITSATVISLAGSSILKGSLVVGKAAQTAAQVAQTAAQTVHQSATKAQTAAQTAAQTVHQSATKAQTVAQTVHQSATKKVMKRTNSFTNLFLNGD